MPAKPKSPPKRKTGPKPKAFDRKILLALSEPLYDRIFAAAAAEGVTASDLLRRLIDSGLSEKKF